ncbi:unnamed protein product [Effrenium voratum]|uniref:Protein DETOXIFICATION n=1 Tax=Effrenium voratum TaxID=2562239 RepID=A0AA36JM75_9DINO|nr:unnamed protein product [Effrenium voratum]CAJ1407563.1 unnamed protein product [Effrenium voratum]
MSRLAELMEAGKLQSKASLARRIVLFIIPGYLLVVVGCLATAVDKAFVGHVSSVQLASIGPASSAYEMWTQTIRAINGAQLALLGNPPDDMSKASIRAVGFVYMTVAGLLAGIAALVMAPTGVRLFGASADMFPFALSYLKVRACFMAMGRIRDSCNVVCLAEKDSVTPFVASVIAFVVNVIGDLLLCPKQGAFGAAIATDVATSAAAGFTLQRLRHSGLWPKQFYCPRRREARHFAKYAVNLFLSAVALLMIIISETCLASKMGTSSGAAHQILDAMWRICGLSLSLPMEWAGQTFLSKDLTGVEWRHTASVLAMVAMCFSLISAGCVLAFLHLRVDVFTTDPLVQVEVLHSTLGVAMCSGLIVLSQTLMSFFISLGKVHFVPVTGGMLVVLFTAGSYVLYMYSMLSLQRMWALKAALLCFAVLWQCCVVLYLSQRR